MSDNVLITPGVGKTIAADEVTDGTLGVVSVQYVKLMDGTLDGTTKAAVGANGLKVDGSGVTQPISISSTTLSGLKVDLERLSVGTSAFAGIRVFQENSPAVTISSPSLSGLIVNIQKVTTSAFAGIRVFQENSPSVTVASAPLSGLIVNVTKATTASFAGIRVFNENNVLASTSISGLKTNITQFKGIAVDTSSGNLSTGTLRVVLATDQPSNTNALKVDNSAVTQPISIASTTISGLKVNQTQIKGIAVSTGNGTSDTGTMRVAIASDNTSFITTVSLAGLKVLDRGIAVNAEQTATTNGLPFPMITDLVGKLITLPYANPENFINRATKLTSTVSSAVIAGIGSTRLYITSLILSNTSSTNTFVTIQDGSGGTTLVVLPAPANSGAVVTLPVPVKTTAGNGLFAKPNAAITTLFVTGVGYKGI